MLRQSDDTAVKQQRVFSFHIASSQIATWKMLKVNGAIRFLIPFEIILVLWLHRSASFRSIVDIMIPFTALEIRADPMKEQTFRDQSSDTSKIL